jgi:hypothetical protein
MEKTGDCSQVNTEIRDRTQEQEIQQLKATLQVGEFMLFDCAHRAATTHAFRQPDS